ncbi:MAG: RNA polymerase factor sigma-54 [Prevotellaceae bacterium]|jgi:RNA polymerase sigma-54 factor|nr:RNA polymerase factor sigma-54 [Prevotellaceae bacterium]
MLKQTLQQKLQQKLSPLQIQTIQLVTLPVMQFEQRVKEELEENPALDEAAADSDDDSAAAAALPPDDDTPAYKLYTPTAPAAAKPEFPALPVRENFRQQLETQMGFSGLTERERTIASFIIGSLDDDGYLRRDLPAVADDIAFRLGIETTGAELEKLLRLLQDCDPPGVGARNLQECLLIQLRRRHAPAATQPLAETILENYFDDFVKKHYDKIRSKLAVDEAALKAAVEEIKRLNPRPAGSSGDAYNEQARQIVPDFLLEPNDGELQLSLLRGNVPSLQLNRRYQQLVDHRAPTTAEERAAAAFVKQKMEAAARFIEAIKQRQQTLLATMQAIIDYQRNYFADGDENKLRPMVLKNIAAATGYDISTVSRVVNSKFIQTHFGIFPLKYFFSEGVKTTAGTEVSTHEMRNILEESIAGEDKKHPLTDEELMAVLKQRGYAVARRTVAKYREQLNIPVARLRKEP